MTKSVVNKSKSRSVLARVGLGRWRGRFAWLAGMLLLTVLVCWLLARVTPAWYLPMDPNDQAVNDASNRATARYMNLWTTLDAMSRPGDQQWSISQDEVNSLLATTFAALDANGHRGAGDVARNPMSGPMVVFGKGELTIAARFSKLPSRDPLGGVGWAVFSVKVITDADGLPMGEVKLEHLRVGNLPVPQFLVRSRLQAMMPEILQIGRKVLQSQLGARDIETTGPMVDEMLEDVFQGRPFSLHISNFRERDFVVRALDFEPGRFTMVLSRTRPPVAGPAIAPGMAPAIQP